VVTILIVFTLAAMVVVFCRSMRVEAIASANLSASLQASTVERGAEQYVIALLTEQKDSLADITEDYFYAVPVGSMPGQNGPDVTGYFWIVRPDYGDIDLPLYGLTEEAAKLNINSAGYESLMRLPNMTDDVANAIIDWRDTDQTPSPGGAENEYYLGLEEPYTAKNDNFETVEELLMVRGVTRELLYGSGGNVPVGQQSGFMAQNSRDQSDLATARGWYDLLPVYSSVAGAAAAGGGGTTGGTTGSGRTGTGSGSGSTGGTTSGGGTGSTGGATGGTSGGTSGGTGGGATGGKINLNDTQNRVAQLRQLLTNQIDQNRANEIVQRIDRNARYDDAFDFYFKVGLKTDEFDKIYNSITTATGAQKGRININTAPRDVLMTLPGLETSDVDNLISQRQGGTTAADKSVSWVIDALQKKAVGLGNLITTTTNQYSADILAASANGRAYKRVRIVVDASGTAPQIIYRREISDRGWPLDPQILASLRAGQGPGGGAGGVVGGGSMPGGTLR
jgi:type II secretory pathway component PulK